MPIDYSLYLVTGRDLLPGGKESYLDSLEKAIQGGATLVQIREKDTETGEFYEIARQSQRLCRRYNIPIIINDRLDIALAIGADGVHLGQSDMPLAIARKLLPEGTIIGISCTDVSDVKRAVQDGADYIGISGVWDTKTKDLTNKTIGIRRVGAMLQELDGTAVKAVAIGGIRSTNALRTLHGCVSLTNHPLDGIAVVSDIIASLNPRSAAEKLAAIVREFKQELLLTKSVYSVDGIISGVCKLMESLPRSGPLVHQITNNVVATQSANVTLAIGASPIMASAPEEMEDISRISNALLVNIGTLRAEGRDGMMKAGHYANLTRKPVVFDPVGIGASAYRKDAVNELLNTWQASVIKGNAAELAALGGSTEVNAKGVDSVGGFQDPASFVKKLALKERCVIVMTGEKDWISDGDTVICLSNGVEMLGSITGSGCILGSCIASYCGAASMGTVDIGLVGGDMLTAAVAGVSILTVASELAMDSGSVDGPGTFLAALVDQLAKLRPEDIERRVKISVTQ